MKGKNIAVRINVLLFTCSFYKFTSNIAITIPLISVEFIDDRIGRVIVMIVTVSSIVLIIASCVILKKWRASNTENRETAIVGRTVITNEKPRGTWYAE